jgi:formylglycine-generating enzyme required for sulfatase activity
MDTALENVGMVYRTSRVSVVVTRRQADRCYGLLRSGGDVWAWMIDVNRERSHRGDAPIVSYQELCRELAARGSFGELSVVGARSVLRRYSDAWFEAAKRRHHGQRAGSHAAGAHSSRFASTTAPSRWKASEFEFL